jgi:hypothetical protein
MARCTCGGALNVHVQNFRELAWRSLMPDYTDIDKLRELAEKHRPTPMRWIHAEDGDVRFEYGDGCKVCEERGVCTISCLVAELVGLRTEVDQLRGENAQLTRERDLAIAHDTQPYPTAWAYEQACRVMHEVKAERDALQARIDAIQEARSCLGAGPMDYEAFTDEVDRILAAAVVGAEPERFRPGQACRSCASGDHSRHERWFDHEGHRTHCLCGGDEGCPHHTPAVPDVLITINRLQYEIEGGVRDVRQIPFPPIADDQDLWRHVPLGGPDEKVTEPLLLVNGMRFYSAPALINNGAVGAEEPEGETE